MSWKSDPQNTGIYSTFTQHHTGYDQRGNPEAPTNLQGHYSY